VNFSLCHFGCGGAKRNGVENGPSGTSDMDGEAARVAASEPGDERVKSLAVFRRLELSTVRDSSTSLRYARNDRHAGARAMRRGFLAMFPHSPPSTVRDSSRLRDASAWQATPLRYARDDRAGTRAVRGIQK
jgi:hypothetical protein